MNLSGTFSLSSLDSFAQELMPLFLEKRILLLKGDLGAGKTTFAKALLLQMNPLLDNVPSPSFPLMIPYETCHGTVWHMDLYRLSEKKAWQELQALGFEEICQTDFMIIEWPDRCMEAFSGLQLELWEHSSHERFYHMSFAQKF
jgi:tRNA threonylcarbamoyladenosine biosynthesis protein TsaE